MTHWAAAYINREPPITYQANGTGPDSFDCWSFVRHIWKERFGLEVPAVECPVDNLARAHLFANHEELERWKRVLVPQEGDGVLLTARKHPHHVGIWITADTGGVLHCQEGIGLTFQSLISLTAHGWRVVGYYRREQAD